MRYTLDSNLCIELMSNPDSKLAAKLKAHAGELCVSAITVHELIHGADKSRRPVYQHELVRNFLSKLEVFEFDDLAAEHSGNIHTALARSGSIIGAYDMLIAGHARSPGHFAARARWSELATTMSEFVDMATVVRSGVR